MPLTITRADIAQCPGLEPLRQRLQQYRQSDHPVLLRGDVSTARAIVGSLFDDPRATVTEIFCSMLDDRTSSFLSALNSVAQQRAGGLLLVEAHRLSADNLRLAQVMARDRVIDARGTPLRARLVCHVEKGSGAFEGRPGAYLDADIPPLRERAADAIALVRQLLSRAKGCDVSIAASEEEMLRCYAWPGDTSELVGFVEKVIASDDGDASRGSFEVRGDLLERLLPATLRHRRRDRAREPPPVDEGQTLRQMMDEYEATIIKDTMARLRGNKTQVAKVLEISRSYLIQKCQKYGLE